MMRDILKYLGYPQDVAPDESVRNLIQKAIAEVEAQAQFRYRYAQYDSPFEFMNTPKYQQYLQGERRFLLCATTIGSQIDRYIKRLQMMDMQYAVIFDAAASVYLEQQADAFEAQLELGELGYRFCPGYGGTPLTDNKLIAQQLRAETIGITFLDSGLMVPMKSMVGIIRMGGSAEKSCDDCLALQHCAYRRRGERCYRK